MFYFLSSWVAHVRYKRLHPKDITDEEKDRGPLVSLLRVDHVGVTFVGTVDAPSIASKEQRNPCKFSWFVVDFLAIFRASTVPRKVSKEYQKQAPILKLLTHFETNKFVCPKHGGTDLASSQLAEAVP